MSCLLDPVPIYWCCPSSPIVAILTGNHVGQGSAVAAAKRWQLSQRLSLPAWAQRQHSQVSLLHLPHRQMPCGVRGRSSRCRAACCVSFRQPGVVGGLRSQYPGLGREFCHLCHLSVLIVFISHDSMSSLHHSFVVLQHSPCSAVEPAICDGLCIPYGPYALQGSVSLCAGLVAYPCCCEWRYGVPALYCSPLTVFLG